MLMVVGLNAVRYCVDCTSLHSKSWCLTDLDDILADDQMSRQRLSMFGASMAGWQPTYHVSMPPCLRLYASLAQSLW